MTIIEKLTIIHKLFFLDIKNVYTNIRIDYESKEGFTRAYHIANFKPIAEVTKSDMKYINTVCKNLINLIGTNIEDIDISPEWYDAYIKLVNEYLHNYIISEKWVAPGIYVNGAKQ